MATREPDDTPHDDARIVSAWEAHLGREEALLAATLDSLGEVRAAIVAADWGKLPGLLGFQDRLADDAADLARERDAVREAASRRTGVPAAEVTLRVLASALPAEKSAGLLATRERLALRAREADVLRRAVVTLVRFSLGFHQKMLEGLAGGRGPDRYSAAGTWRGAAFGSLIQARG
jgi:hypothetical protein